MSTSESPMGNSETLKPLSLKPPTGVSTYEYKCSANSNFDGLRECYNRAFPQLTVAGSTGPMRKAF